MSHSPSPIDLTRNEAITGESLGESDDYLPPLNFRRLQERLVRASMSDKLTMLVASTNLSLFFRNVARDIERMRRERWSSLDHQGGEKVAQETMPG